MTDTRGRASLTLGRTGDQGDSVTCKDQQSSGEPQKEKSLHRNNKDHCDRPTTNLLLLLDTMGRKNSDWAVHRLSKLTITDKRLKENFGTK